MQSILGTVTCRHGRLFLITWYLPIMKCFILSNLETTINLSLLLHYSCCFSGARYGNPSVRRRKVVSWIELTIETGWRSAQVRYWAVVRRKRTAIALLGIGLARLNHGFTGAIHTQALRVKLPPQLTATSNSKSSTQVGS